MYYIDSVSEPIDSVGPEGVRVAWRGGAVRTVRATFVAVTPGAVRACGVDCPHLEGQGRRCGAWAAHGASGACP